MRAGMIGLGKLGLPVAEAMSAAHQVFGYDVQGVTSPLISITSSMAQLVEHSDIVFIAVQTPHDPLYDGSTPSSHLDNKDFDYTHVIGVLNQLEQLDISGKMVVMISTVLPGTTRRLLAPCLTKADLIYNPYLIAMGTVAHDMVNPEMVMIGNCSGQLDGSVERLLDFYRPIMQNDPRMVTGTWEEMESTKIFYNTFISAKLSLVNMIQDVAERVGHMNVDVTAKALADSSYRIMGPAYMKPGMGDGGPCHPRDNIALRYMAQRLDLGYDLFDAIMRAREVQAENLAKELVKHGLPVHILGKSFKPGVPYTDGSYSMLVGHYCEQLGTTVLYDAVDRDNASVYLLAHQCDYSDIIGIMARGSVVVDPWRSAVPADGVTVVHWGNTRDRIACPNAS
jgi:UDPglucose 6-dehydrogenase